MSERIEQRIKIAYFVVGTPLIAAGTAMFMHGNSVDNARNSERNLERQAISNQVDNVFLNYSPNEVDTASQFIARIENELTTLIAQGKVEEAKQSLSNNPEKLNEAAVITTDQELQNKIKLNLENQEGLNARGGGSWFTFGGAFIGMVGLGSVLSGALSEVTERFRRRRLKGLDAEAL